MNPNKISPMLNTYKSVNDYKEIRNNAIKAGFKTPNSYGGNEYGTVPKSEGVYFLLSIDSNDFKRSEILYVGRSKNLRQRQVKHPVIRFLKSSLDSHIYLQTWFLPTSKSNEIEIDLISTINPKFNKRHRNG